MNAEFRKERKKMEKIRKHAPLPDCPVCRGVLAGRCAGCEGD